MQVSARPDVLIVDDDARVLEALDLLLTGEYRTHPASSGSEAVEVAKQNPDIAVVVMDIRMPGMDGIEAGRLVRQQIPEVPVIFHTAYAGEYDESEINEGEQPFDYIAKGGGQIPRLLRAVRNAVDSCLSKRSSKHLFADAESLYGMIGRSPGMQNVFRLINKVAATDTKVLILGETGTGKEEVARAIYSHSGRRDKKLGVVNCNHKSTELVEAELFGYMKGAFSGAYTDRRGLFEIADGGTVFLDEIGDLAGHTQGLLLRVLQSGEFRQMGPEAEMTQTDVRIICATNKGLKQMTESGDFREDLYYRLSTVTIELPPLRERGEDILILTERFVDQFTIEVSLPPKVLDSDARQVLLEYHWPGNVRELLNVIESLVVLSDSDLISGDDVRNRLSMDSRGDSTADESQSLNARIDEFRRSCIIEALHESKNNVRAAARRLQLDPAALRRWIAKYGIKVSVE